MSDRNFIYLLWLVWTLTETAHFGWNALPKSEAEMFADGGALLLLALAHLAPKKKAS